MFDLLVGFAILIFGIISIKQSEKSQPKKIFKVYTQPGRWYRLKYFIFLMFLILRRLKYYIVGKNVLVKKEKLEKLQMLSNHELAFDAVFFHAVSRDGIYFCGGIERRQKSKIVGLVYLVLPDYGILESVHLPKTTLDAEPSSLFHLDRYAGGGLTITPVKPMKKWKISFSGKMRSQKDPKKIFDVELNADWRSDYDWIYFEFDTPAKVIARSMAREVWNRQFFKNLKS
nr:uncharacterized protein LOC111514783 [Leptinotarsa decemlineata]